MSEPRHFYTMRILENCEYLETEDLAFIYRKIKRSFELKRPIRELLEETPTNAESNAGGGSDSDRGSAGI